MAENIKEYREGYNAGKAAGPASIIGHGFFSMVYSDDYREGFRDAQEGKDFNPAPSRLNEPDLADEVGGCLFGIFMSGIELFFCVLFWPVSKLYDLLGFKVFCCILLAVLAVVMVTHPFRPPAPRERGETSAKLHAFGLVSLSGLSSRESRFGDPILDTWTRNANPNASLSYFPAATYRT